MKKLILVAMTAILAGTLMMGCSQKAEESTGDESLTYITEKGTFVLGLDDTFPPMGFRDDNNEIVGFDIDLAQAVCDELGVELVLQPIDWKAKENEIATKRIDAIWNGFSITEEREANMTLSNPYMDNNMAIVVKNADNIADQAGLAGKKLAVQGGSSAETALDSAKELKDSLAEVVAYDSNTVALVDLEAGGVDAVLMDSVVADYFIASNGKDFSLLKDVISSEHYAVGFRKGEEALKKAVDDAFVALKESGELAEISTKWFGSDVTTIQ